MSKREPITEMDEWIKSELAGDAVRERIRDHWQEHGPRLAKALRRCVDAYGHGNAEMCEAVSISIHTLIAAEKVPGDE